MQGIQSTAIIRERGQLTIPEQIRRILHWSSSNSVVSITVVSKNELVVKPYENQKKINWDQIWSNINSSRSFKGKKGNLSGFVVADRDSH